MHITRHLNILKNILRLSKIEIVSLPDKPEETTFAAKAHASIIDKIVKKMGYHVEEELSLMTIYKNKDGIRLDLIPLDHKTTMLEFVNE